MRGYSEPESSDTHDRLPCRPADCGGRSREAQAKIKVKRGRSSFEVCHLDGLSGDVPTPTLPNVRHLSLYGGSAVHYKPAIATASDPNRFLYSIYLIQASYCCSIS